MNPVLYLIMRNDIPSMNPGKLAAQAAHVANAFEFKFNKSGWAKKNLGKLYKVWKNQTDQGFGTTITLEANGGFIANLDLNPFCRDKFLGGRVYDPTYPCHIPTEIAAALSKKFPNQVHWDNTITNSSAIFFRNELVGVYIFGDKDESSIIDRIGKLELYP